MEKYWFRYWPPRHVCVCVCGARARRSRSRPPHCAMGNVNWSAARDILYILSTVCGRMAGRPVLYDAVCEYSKQENWSNYVWALERTGNECGSVAAAAVAVAATDWLIAFGTRPSDGFVCSEIKSLRTYGQPENWSKFVFFIIREQLRLCARFGSVRRTRARVRQLNIFGFADNETMIRQFYSKLNFLIFRHLPHEHKFKLIYFSQLICH